MTQILPRTALILLATSAIGACTTSGTTPNFPINTPPVSAPPPAAPAPAVTAPKDEAPTAPRPTEAVESRPLDAPTATAPVVAESAPLETPPPRPEPEPEPQRAAPAPPRYETVSKRTVTGKVVAAAGEPVVYTVKSGDNLDRISKRLGLTVEELKKLNKLKTNRIDPGDTLKGPADEAKAYVVGQGDTLSSIGRRFGVTVEQLRAENKLARNAALRNGQKIRLPDGYKDRGPITTTTQVLVSGSEAALVRTPEPVAPRRPTARPAPVVAQPADEPEPEPVEEAAPATVTTYRTVTTRTVTGRVIEVAGPPVTYTVKSGDNLSSVARKLDTTVDDLMKDNKLKSSRLDVGDKLKGPAGTSKAYVTNSGDTLAAIAQRFRVTPKALAAENDLKVGATIRAGRRLTLPDGYRDRGALTTTTRVPVETAVRPSQTRPEPATLAPEPRPVAPAWTPPPLPPRTAPVPTPTPTPMAPPAATSTAPGYLPPEPAFRPAPIQRDTAPPATSGVLAAGDMAIANLGQGRFVWPMQGDIISDFGPKSVGQRNDGLNLRAQVGMPVRAAASGDVVYAGDQVPGFGNLVLIKHADGWVTAYGHLSRVDVKMQQKVAQGQTIGQAGATGAVTEPQLHFEVRFAPNPTERARPVDPKLVLPSR
jgi:murein DD-endopeptidase MepM/ murein hydrolase activator NlpD